MFNIGVKFPPTPIDTAIGTVGFSGAETYVTDSAATPTLMVLVAPWKAPRLSAPPRFDGRFCGNVAERPEAEGWFAYIGTSEQERFLANPRRVYMETVSDLVARRLEDLEAKLKRLQVVTGILSALVVGIAAFHWIQISRAPADLIAKKLSIVDAHGIPWFVVSVDDVSGRREMVLRDGAGRRRADVPPLSVAG